MASFCQPPDRRALPVYPRLRGRLQLLTRAHSLIRSPHFRCAFPRLGATGDPLFGLIMASPTPADDVPGQSTALTKERGVGGLHPSFWVAEGSRRSDRSRRSWHPKNQRILSVIVMLVTDTGDKVVYRLGRSKGRSRTPTSCGGPTRGRRGDRSPFSSNNAD